MTSENPTRPGAADLIRSLGLMVDGPVAWGRPIASRAPGIFIVELSEPAQQAPIDHTALRHWLERVPELTVDGESPDATILWHRLAEFWLPDEPVVFIGRSSRSIGQRLAAVYKTPLGDARPSSLGYWLKTLTVLPNTRTWWADTEAHEEYEDALLDEIAARNDGQLPFANLSSASRGMRAHGLANALRDPRDMPARPASGQSVSGPTRRAPAVRRPRRPATTSTPRSSKAGKPPPEPTFLSAEGVDRLTAELEELRNNVRPLVIARVKAARELGDLRENGDYEYARKEQSFVEGRIQTIEALLRSTQVIDTSISTDTVRMGSTVEIESDGHVQVYLIVGSSEADPAAGRLSYQSPVGQALLGAQAGDNVMVELPNGQHRYRVVAVR